MWKLLMPSCRICRKVTESPCTHHSVGVVPEDIVPLWVQVRRFVKRNWEVVPEILPDGPLTEEWDPAASTLRSTSVPHIPTEVAERNPIILCEEQQVQAQEQTAEAEEEEA